MFYFFELTGRLCSRILAARDYAESDNLCWLISPAVYSARRNQMKVLFFSRGRGRGHAIPDVAIMREVRRLRPDTTCEIASYSTGARTIESLDERVHDLQLPEENPF